MATSVNRLFQSSRRNKSEAIADRIEQELLDLGLQPGDRLPSERELMAAYGAALGTIRRALELLEQRGLVRRRARSGTFYTGAPERGESAAAPLDLSPPGSAPVLSIFTHTTQTLSFYAKELAHPACRHRWEAFAEWASDQLPGTRIVPQGSPAGSLADAVLRDSPDVVFDTERELERLAAVELLTPLHTLDWLDPADFFASTHQAIDGLGAVPYSLSVGLKVWNDELLALSGQGLPEPAVGATLSPLLKALAEKGRNAVAATFIHMPLYQWLEDGIIDWDPATGACELDRAAAAESLAFNRAMFRQLRSYLDQGGGKSPPSHPYDFWLAFSAGRVLMMDTYSYVLGHLPGQVAFPLRVQAPPLFAGQAVAVNPNLLALTPACVHRDRAVDFIRLAVSREGQERFAATLHNVPARRDVAASPAYLGRAPAGMEKVLAALDEETSLFRICPLLNHSRLEAKSLDAALACYQGNREIAETVDSLAALLRLMVASFRR